MKIMLALLRARSAASAAEYALILAIIGTGLALAAFLLGNVAAGAMNDAGTCIESAGSSCS